MALVSGVQVMDKLVKTAIYSLMYGAGKRKKHKLRRLLGARRWSKALRFLRRQGLNIPVSRKPAKMVFSWDVRNFQIQSKGTR
jgi:hypothetical protein